MPPTDEYPNRFPPPGEEGWLGQIWLNGRWADYARGYEDETRQWQAAEPATRRIVHWITRDILVFSTNACDGCGKANGPVCPECQRQVVREQDDRWQVETDDDIRMSRSGGAWRSY
jgi:hypothetical protein